MVNASSQAPSAALTAEPTLSSVPLSGPSAAQLLKFGPYRVMTIGSALLAKDGVAYHGLMLPSAVGRRLTELAGHEVVMDSHFTTQSTLAALEREMPRHGLTRVDALILCLDQRSSRATASRAAHHVRRLVEDLWLRVVPGTTITLVLPPPSITGWSVERTTEFSFELRARINGLIRVVQLVDRYGAGAVERNYGKWVDDIAETVAGGLLEPLEELDPEHASADPREIRPSIQI